MRRNCISTSELFKTDALTCFEISDESVPKVSASYIVGAKINCMKLFSLAPISDELHFYIAPLHLQMYEGE